MKKQIKDIYKHYVLLHKFNKRYRYVKKRIGDLFNINRDRRLYEFAAWFCQNRTILLAFKDRDEIKTKVFLYGDLYVLKFIEYNPITRVLRIKVDETAYVENPNICRRSIKIYFDKHNHYEISKVTINIINKATNTVVKTYVKDRYWLIPGYTDYYIIRDIISYFILKYVSIFEEKNINDKTIPLDIIERY